MRRKKKSIDLRTVEGQLGQLVSVIDMLTGRFKRARVTIRTLYCRTSEQVLRVGSGNLGKLLQIILLASQTPSTKWYRMYVSSTSNHSGTNQ
jgi:hypothetical protein